MGAMTWLLAGGLASLLARLVPRLRRSWILELAVAAVAALVAGVVATALDFGGWQEADWRAALFAFFAGLAMIAVVRMLGGRDEN